MELNFISFVFIIVFATFFLSSSIKIAREDQRFAVFRLGRFMGIKGPGLIYVIPVTDKVHKLSLGDSGELLASGQARFGKVTVPVESGERLEVGSAVRIMRFKDSSVVVTHGLGKGRKVMCPKCSHEMAV